MRAAAAAPAASAKKTMRIQLECHPCLLRQAARATRFAGGDNETAKRVLERAFTILQSHSGGRSPLTIAARLLDLVREQTGVADPFAAEKTRSNAEARRWLPQLRRQLAAEPDPLEFALKAAVAGNIMDYGAFASFDLESLLASIHQRSFRLSARDQLESRLDSARTLAYLADNAGEIEFDRLLIEHLLATYPLERLRLVVRSSPFLNDVCAGDQVVREFEGIERLEVLQLSVDTAHRDPAVWREIVGSDVIVAKGMANFENYSERDDFLFLVIAKCGLVSREVSQRSGQHVDKGDWLLV